VNQEESEHNEVDGMKKGVDSKGEVMLFTRKPSDHAQASRELSAINTFPVMFAYLHSEGEAHSQWHQFQHAGQPFSQHVLL